MENQSKPGQPSGTVQDLIILCRSGNVGAFKTIMERHERFVYLIAYRILLDRENTKDVVQETFIRVWNNINRYDHAVKFTTWLYSIAVNLCYDRLKKDKRRNRTFSLFSRFAGINEIRDQKNLEDEISNKNMLSNIIRIGQKLPPKQRIVFILRDMNDFSIPEIAEITHMSISSVKTNLCYARQRIRERIEILERQKQ